jgi:hypothetical protein
MRRLKITGIIVLILTFLFLPLFQVSAHPEPVDTITEYKLTVEINGISIAKDPNWYTANDQNFFGGADALFDYNIDPTNPDHEGISGITNPTFSIASGESVTFDEPIEIYSHTICNCDQEIETDISVLDFAPIKKTVYVLFKKGVSLGGTYLTSGPLGVGIDLLGEALSKLAESVTHSSLTEDEKELYAIEQVVANSDLIGRMIETNNINCDNSENQYKEDLLLEERAVGDVVYTIKMTETGESCPFEEVEEEASNADDEEKEEESGTTDAPATSQPPEQAVSASACLSATTQIIDLATGYLSPDLTLISGNRIKWDAGIGSCKNQDAVIADFSANIQSVLPSNIAQCPTLQFLGGEGYEGCGINFYFQY